MPDIDNIVCHSGFSAGRAYAGNIRLRRHPLFEVPATPATR